MGELFNVHEAAAELQRLTQTSWTAAQVLRAAKSGRLPVCFDFVGELVVHSVDGRLEPGGTRPRVLDFDGVVRSLTRPTADGICGFGVLVEIKEAHSFKFSHKDGKRTRGIALPTEYSYGGRIKVGHKVECWIEDAGVTTDAFLFHTDDLNKLISTAQAVPALSELAPVPAQPQAAPATVGAESASNASAWIATKPQRYSGYTAPLHRLIAAAHREGRPRPTARDVVEAWRINAPAEIAKMLPDGFDYYDAKGDTKTANLEAIRKAIGRMTSPR